MAWVRVHDAAMSHPKIVGLSDKAFRLWVWGLSYSQTHLTDGAVPGIALPAGAARTASDLLAAGLWERNDSGYQIHDYLDWNDSKDTVTKKRIEAKDRMRRSRESRSREQYANVLQRTSRREVPRGVGSTTSFSEEKDSDELYERAGRLREELYPAWYARERNGARLRLVANSLELQDALTLVRTWDDARLEKLARIILTTDDPFIAGTDRSFKIFALKATWADDRLRQWELANKVSA